MLTTALVHKLIELNIQATIVVDTYTIRYTSDKRPKTILFFIMDGIESIRKVLSGDSIFLDKVVDDDGIFARVDAFINLS